MSSRSYLSIGDVLTLLREEFPDVTISKIRFLESQGLVNPERSPSGYRKFFEHDVERLRWVLRQQREHFLPLKVIRDRLSGGELDDLDAAGEPVKGAADTEPSVIREPARRNGRAAEPAHVGAGLAASAAGAAAGSAGGGVHPGPSRTEEQSAQANDDALKRILADASRRAALIPEPAGERPVLRALRDEPEAGEATSAATDATVEKHSSGAHPSAAAGASGDTTTRAGASGGGASDARSRTGSASRPGERGTAGAPTDAGTVAAGGGAEPATSASREAGRASAPAGVKGAEAPAVSSAVAPAAAPAGAAGHGSSAGAAGRSGQSTGAGAGAAPAAASAAAPKAHSIVTGASLTAEELCAATGLSEVELASLQGFGLIEAIDVAGITTFDEEALTMANLAADFRKFGIEPRHLRLYRNSVDRELGLIEQVIIPLLRQRNPESRQRAVEAADELGTLGQAMRASLLRSALRRHVGG